MKEPFPSRKTGGLSSFGDGLKNLEKLWNGGKKKGNPQLGLKMQVKSG